MPFIKTAIGFVFKYKSFFIIGGLIIAASVFVASLLGTNYILNAEKKALTTENISLKNSNEQLRADNKAWAETYAALVKAIGEQNESIAQAGEATRTALALAEKRLAEAEQTNLKAAKGVQALEQAIKSLKPGATCKDAIAESKKVLK